MNKRIKEKIIEQNQIITKVIISCPLAPYYTIVTLVKMIKQFCESDRPVGGFWNTFSVSPTEKERLPPQ